MVSHFCIETATREMLIAELLRTQEIAAELASELHWTYQVLENPSFKGAEPRVYIAARREAQAVKPREADGLKHVYRESLAKKAGVSPQTVSSCLAKFSQAELVTVKHERKYDAEKEQNTTDLLIDVPIVTPPREIQMESNYGGKREKANTCVSCGGELQKKTTITCKSCGQVQKEEIKDLTSEDQAEAGASSAGEGQAEELTNEIFLYNKLIELVGRGICAPSRTCYRCNTDNWLPYREGENWAIACGTCHPEILQSRGNLFIVA